MRPVLVGMLGAVTILAVTISVSFLPQPAIPLPDELAFPLTATYDVQGPDGVTTRVEVQMESWGIWRQRVLSGDSAGYITLADESGRVVAGYDSWPQDEWVELRPAGSPGLALPNSWLHPYHFPDGNMPGEDRPVAAAQVKTRLGLAEGDEVRAYRTDQGQTVVYHPRTNLPLQVSEPGFTLRMVSISTNR